MIYRETESVDMSELLETLLSLRFRRMTSEATVLDVTKNREAIQSECDSIKESIRELERSQQEQLSGVIRAMEVLRMPRGEPQPNNKHILSRIDAQDARIMELQDDIATLGDLLNGSGAGRSVVGWDS